MRGRRAAALGMAQDADPGAVAALIEVDRKPLREAGFRAFRDDDDAAAFSAADAAIDRSTHGFDRLFLLGRDDRLGAATDSDLHRDEARASAHDFDDENPVVRACGIADPVDRVERGIDRGIEPDRILGSGDIVINRPGNSDAGKIVFLLEKVSAGEGAVPADHDQAVDFLPA